MTISQDEFIIRPCCEIEYCAILFSPGSKKEVTMIPVRIKFCPLCGEPLTDQ